jgi:hypothetical protein
MDEKSFKKTVNALSSPVVLPFIDGGRVAKSAAYQELVIWAVAHHRQTGDYTYLLRLLEIVAKSTVYLPTLKWIADRTGLKYFVADDYDGKSAATPIKFAKNVEGKAVSMEPYLTRYRGTRHQVIESLSNHKTRQKKNSAARDGDAMARRLPGSFEHGKRR